jgi:hypothetical protein
VTRNNRKKRRNPLVRLTVFVIILVIIGFLIFYIIDNPGFLKEFFRGDGDSQAERTLSSDPEEEINTIESEASAMGEGEVQAESSLWQRVVEFFRDKFNPPREEESYSPRLTINVYFARTGPEKILAAEERTIIAGNPGNALKSAMEELLAGPSQDYHYPVIPAGTKLLVSRVADGVAEIDLSKEFLDNALDNRILDEYIIYSIVNTLTEIPDINGVTFFIGGKRIKTYGNIDLSIPLIHNPDLIEE